MSTTYRPTSEIRDIAKALGYRKRQFGLQVATTVTLSDLNWSGGTRSEYTAIELATGAARSPDLGRPAPWNNKAEGATIEIPAGVVIARTGAFCGKPSTMTLYVRPEDMAPLLELGDPMGDMMGRNP